MSVFLGQRLKGRAERMDRPDCDPGTLTRTYARFATVNRLVSRWRHLYKRWLRPALAGPGPKRVLDIGFGGGDVLLSLASWAERDGLKVDFVGIDADPRALAYIETQRENRPLPGNVRFDQASAQDLLTRRQRFDLVVSNHLLHHLEEADLLEFCDISARLSRGPVLHNDLLRHDLAFASFALLSLPLAPGSYITADGLTSIRRSYRPAELRDLVAEGWRIHALFPYRLLLTRGL